jgi:hypothetical protein
MWGDKRRHFAPTRSIDQWAGRSIIGRMPTAGQAPEFPGGRGAKSLPHRTSQLAQIKLLRLLTRKAHKNHVPV